MVLATPRRGWLCGCDNGNLLCTFLYLAPQKIEGALAAFASTSPAPSPSGAHFDHWKMRILGNNGRHVNRETCEPTIGLVLLRVSVTPWTPKPRYSCQTPGGREMTTWHPQNKQN